MRPCLVNDRRIAFCNDILHQGRDLHRLGGLGSTIAAGAMVTPIGLARGDREGFFWAQVRLGGSPLSKSPVSRFSGYRQPARVGFAQTRACPRSPSTPSPHRHSNGPTGCVSSSPTNGCPRASLPGATTSRTPPGRDFWSRTTARFQRRSPGRYQGVGRIDQRPRTPLPVPAWTTRRPLPHGAPKEWRKRPAIANPVRGRSNDRRTCLVDRQRAPTGNFATSGSVGTLPPPSVIRSRAGLSTVDPSGSGRGPDRRIAPPMSASGAVPNSVRRRLDLVRYLYAGGRRWKCGIPACQKQQRSPAGRPIPARRLAHRNNQI